MFHRYHALQFSILHFRPHLTVIPLSDWLIPRGVLLINASRQALHHCIWICTHKVHNRVSLAGHAVFTDDPICERWQRDAMKGRLQRICNDISIGSFKIHGWLQRSPLLHRINKSPTFTTQAPSIGVTGTNFPGRWGSSTSRPPHSS